MKKLKILIGALSVMTLMCFANSASANVSHQLTTNDAANYYAEVIQFKSGVLVPLNESRILTLPLLNNVLTADLDSEALNSNSLSSIVVKTNDSNQIMVEAEANVNIKTTSKQFSDSGIEISRIILMELQ